MKQKKLAVLLMVVIISLSFPGFVSMIPGHTAVSHSVTVAKKPFPYIYRTFPVNVSGNNSAVITQSSVNPSRLYSTEPAPMGIADYGIGSGGLPYEYNSSSFEGVINVSSLQTYNSSLTSSYYGYRYGMSFQLNTVLSFTFSGLKYVYWTQDVAFLNTSNHTLYIIDNVWNFTSANSKIHSSTITGNGQVKSTEGFYYDLGGSPAGGDSTMKYPSTLSLRINTTLSSGVPEVLFQYNAGLGWITFDSPRFTFANGASTPAFVVDGNSYTPLGNFYDSELILGGPAGGSQTNANASNLNLTLLYWNGHNYQAVQNAFNHGSDTAEGIGNVTVSEGIHGENGSPYAKVSTRSGNLGMLYSRSDIAILNVSVPLASSGTLYVNNTAYPFVGSDVNVTLLPEAYVVSVNTSMKEYNLGDISLAAGEYLSLQTENIFSSVLTESGLPSGTQWFVNISSIGRYSSSSNTITIVLPNGTYTYTLGTMNKNYYNHTIGKLTVNGLGHSINVTFEPYLYSVSFVESGLNGTQWAVYYANSVVNRSKSDQIGFMSMNGTFDFWVQIVIGYASNVTSGTVTVNGTDVTHDVVFARARDYNISFTEKGLKNNSLWYLNLTDGQSENSTSPTIVYEMPNGSYGYYDSAGIKYSTSNGQIQINGTDLNVSLNFTELGFLNISVVQSNTTLFLNGNSQGIIGTGFSSYLLPGNYTLSDSLNRYQAFTDYFIIVPGRNTSIMIDLTPMPFYGYLEGAVSPGDAIITANGNLIQVINGSFDALLPPGTYYLTASANGYRAVEFQVTILLLNVTVHNVTLVPSASVIVSGFVKPALASVVIQNLTAYVNSSGYYFLWMQRGNYTISVYSPGYYPASSSISILSNTRRNFTLMAEPEVTSRDVFQNIVALGFGLSVGNLSISDGIISATFDSTSSNGTIVITVPYAYLGSVNISELLSSRVYVGNQIYSNFFVAISSNHTVVLYLYGLHGDPEVSWLYSPNADMKNSNHILDYVAVAVLLIAILGIGAELRRRK